MNVRARRVSGNPTRADLVPRANDLARLHHHSCHVRVHGHVAVAVIYRNRVPVRISGVAGERDPSGARRVQGLTYSARDVGAMMELAMITRTER